MKVSRTAVLVIPVEVVLEPRSDEVTVPDSVETFRLLASLFLETVEESNIPEILGSRTGREYGTDVTIQQSGSPTIVIQ